MIELNSVSVKKNEKTILDSVSFSTAPGECLGIIGSNGAGKSTLLNTILGYEPISNGRIQVNNLELNSISLEKRAKYFAYVSTNTHCPFDFSVKEIVQMGRYPYSQTNDCSETILNEVISQTNLSKLSHKSIQTLSTGEWQRVQLARAFAQNTNYIILDEPLAHLDLYYQEEISSILKAKQKDDKIGILMTSHQLSHIENICSKVLMLKLGKVVDIVPSSELNADLVRKVFSLPETWGSI